MWRSDWIRLEIFGLDFYSPWYPLSIAYVSLETSMTDLIEDILEANPRTVLFPDVRYTVTARPTAIPEDWLIGHKFQQISLQPMSPVLMRKFVSHWYEAARHRTNDNEERELLSRYEMSLLASISDDTHLRDLADTPLLAGLLCSLNRHLKSHLPRRRSEIYERAIIMFDQRDRIREISTEGLALEATSKTYLLASLGGLFREGTNRLDIAACHN